MLLLLATSACGQGQLSSVDQTEDETLVHEYEEKGLALTATATIGEDIEVKAVITNISEEPIVYNDGCGGSLSLYAEKEDVRADLITSEGAKVCNAIFDPDDLREMQPNETIEKEVVIKRQLRLSNSEVVDALSGAYKINIYFQLHEQEPFHTVMPFELLSDEEPDILTVAQAEEMAMKSEEVQSWFQEQEDEGLSIESEDPILGGGMWTVMFRTKPNGAERIVINMDAKSGEIEAVHVE